MAAPVDALTQNQKIFDLFKTKFASPEKFLAAAKKFGPWLNNEKAYYPAARTEIVDILLIAEKTLRAAGFEQYQALVDAYTKIIERIMPFHDKFVEPDLHAAVGKLITDVNLHNPPPAAPPNPTPDIDHPAAPPPSGISPSQHMRPSSSSLASALAPTVSGTRRPSNSQTSLPVSSVPHLPAVPATANTPAAVKSGSAPAPPTSAPRPKRKRKKNDLSDLIQVDLQNRKRKTGTIQNPGEDAQTPTTPTVTLNVPGVSDVSSSVISPSGESALATSPHDAMDMDISASASPAAPILSERNASSGPPQSLVTVKENASVDSGAVYSNGVDVVMNVQEQSEDIKMDDQTHHDVLHASPFVPHVHNTTPEPQNSVPGVLSPVLTPAMDVEVNRVLRTLTQPAPSSEAIDANGPSADAMLPTPHDTGRSPQFHVTGSQQTQLTSEATKDTHSTSMERLKDTQLEAEREDRQPSPQLNTPAAVQAIFKTMVDNVNKLIASSTDMSDVSVPVEELPTPPSSERSPQAEDARSWPMETSSEHPANLPVSHTGEGIYLEDITPSPKTGIQAATVIARHRGLTNGTITIDFSINPNQLESIMKWNNRAKHHEDIEESLCITLLCFSLADIKTRMESSESKDFRSLLPELECLWPKTGGLTMNALWNGQRINFPLAPPFALPSNGFVDVSPFLVSGKNTVCITQTRDMSKYWIILCAHHPTTSQIHTVARRRYKERNWTGWLDKISQPLQLPFRIPIEV